MGSTRIIKGRWNNSVYELCEIELVWAAAPNIVKGGGTLNCAGASMGDDEVGQASGLAKFSGRQFAIRFSPQITDVGTPSPHVPTVQCFLVREP